MLGIMATMAITPLGKANLFRACDLTALLLPWAVASWFSPSWYSLGGLAMLAVFWVCKKPSFWWRHALSAIGMCWYVWLLALPLGVIVATTLSLLFDIDLPSLKVTWTGDSSAARGTSDYARRETDSHLTEVGRPEADGGRSVCAWGDPWCPYPFRDWTAPFTADFFDR